MEEKKVQKTSYIDAIRLEYLRYRDILYDKVAGLPTVPLIIETLRKTLDKNQTIGIIVIDLTKYIQFEKAYGWEIIDEIIRAMADAIRNISREKEWENIIIPVNRARGDDIILFVLSPYKKKILDSIILRDIKNKIINRVLAEIMKKLAQKIYGDFNIYSGYSLVYNEPNIRLERLIYQGIKDASLMAADFEKSDKQFKILCLKKIINKEEIEIVFQPIVDIIGRKVIGYEALARGPKKSEMANPEILFSIASDGNMIWELERLCREKALHSFPKFKKGQYIFLNNEPEVIYDPRFQAMEIIKKLKIPPENIVLEITERTAIKDFTAFMSAISYFKLKGFKISVDDVGSGYASLKTIALLNPDFVKFDINLIRNIDNNLIKQNLVVSLIDIANKINATIIAEGVETSSEFSTIKELGIRCVQGYYLAKPGKPFPPVNFVKLKKDEKNNLY